MRKDVERAFGAPQDRFDIICGPVHMWLLEHLKSIMKVCIILHNMIFEDQHKQEGQAWAGLKGQTDVESLPVRDMCKFNEFFL